MENKLCVYPGSFDPVTLGHLDIIERASRLFPVVRIAVLDNPDKQKAFTAAKRMAMLKKACAHLPNVQIDGFSGLLADYMRKLNASVVIRGLRSMSDFEMEFQMAQMNRQLLHSMESLFLMTSPEYAQISSSIVKQVAMFGGDIAPFVPACVLEEIKKHFQPK